MAHGNVDALDFSTTDPGSDFCTIFTRLQEAWQKADAEAKEAAAEAAAAASEAAAAAAEAAAAAAAADTTNVYNLYFRHAMLLQPYARGRLIGSNTCESRSPRYVGQRKP